MRNPDVEEVGDYFCRSNQENILLLANRLGWNVIEFDPWGKDWFWCLLRRAARWRPDAAGDAPSVTEPRSLLRVGVRPAPRGR
jgi:hypothetical protein